MNKKVTSLFSVLLIVLFSVWQLRDQPDNLSNVTTIDSYTVQSVDQIDLNNPPSFEKFLVSDIRSVDGDTFAFYQNGQEYKLRLLMVDTPETVKQNVPVQPFGKEASQFTQEQLKNNPVYLMFDKGPVMDDYGRLLAYVYVGEESLQELLLENGFGIVRYVNEGGDSLVEDFLAAQKIAQGNSLGVWSRPGYLTKMSNGYYRFNEVSK